MDVKHHRTKEEASELRSCVKVEEAVVPDSPVRPLLTQSNTEGIVSELRSSVNWLSWTSFLSLTVRTASVDVKQH